MTTSIVAADGDTWGISGPDFLGLYIGLALLATVAAFVWRRAYLRGPSLRRAADLTATQAALLNGDRRLAVYSSLAALRAAGAVDTVAKGQLRQTGYVPTGASELDRAVHAAAGRGFTTTGVQQDPLVNDVLNRAEAELGAAGWILDEDRRGAVRMGSLIVFAVAAIGVARLLAGLLNDRPVAYLLILTLIVVFIAFRFRRVPRVTAAGKRQLARMRAAAHHLSPGQSPAWSTYGPAAAALSVGLFGATALWVADPSFAEAAEVQRNLGGSSGTSTSYDGTGSNPGGDSGSSSCSSSSSSCSGGSSCGGGGCGG